MVHHVSIINVIPGGMIADKLIGQKAVLLVLSSSVSVTVLVLTQTWAFYTGLGLVLG
jgi:POT family proton-dependent oligopeptide transporter